MRVFLEQLINGLTIGSFYGLIALGYSMVYGVLKLINFAHGDFFALGSYVGYTLLVFASGFVTTHVGLWGGLVVTVAVAALAWRWWVCSWNGSPTARSIPPDGFPRSFPRWAPPSSCRTSS